MQVFFFFELRGSIAELYMRILLMCISNIFVRYQSNTINNVPYNMSLVKLSEERNSADVWFCYLK